jgi:hypothetical protein
VVFIVAQTPQVGGGLDFYQDVFLISVFAEKSMI